MSKKLRGKKRKEEDSKTFRFKDKTSENASRLSAAGTWKDGKWISATNSEECIKL